MKQLSIWLPTAMLTILLALEAPRLIQETGMAPLSSFDNSIEVAEANPSGDFNGQITGGTHAMAAVQSDPFIGEIVMFAGNFAPQGWALCSGQLLPIAQNTALFSILGTTYGGDGETTFGLPDLRGRVPIHPGNGPGLPSYNLGQKGGQSDVTLTVNQIPAHHHMVAPGARNGGGDETNPGGGFMASATTDLYADSPSASMGATQSSTTGGSASHTNIQPYNCVNFIIALVGVYPSN